MKRLYVIRHAKSSWADTDIPDVKRPLNERGKRDAPRMAKRLKEREIHPDFVISSHAKRCRSTARRMGEILDFDATQIKITPKLYHADEGGILKVVQELRNKHDHVFLYGHNPGLTDFVNAILSEETEFDNLPTCSVCALEFHVHQWAEVTWGTGSLAFFDFPKNAQD